MKLNFRKSYLLLLGCLLYAPSHTFPLYPWIVVWKAICRMLKGHLEMGGAGVVRWPKWPDLEQALTHTPLGLLASPNVYFFLKASGPM